MNQISFAGLVGSIERIEPFISTYVIPRKVDIWLPPDYEQKTQQRYAVLYMHDGENLYDPENSKFSHTDWGIDETITHLMAEGKIRPTIVVGIWSTEKRVLEYMPEKLPASITRDRMMERLKKYAAGDLCSDEYLKFIVNEVKPFVDNNYRTLTDFRNTFIMGSSMGGLISLYAMCEYPHVFGGAGCVSTHFPIGHGIVINYLKDHLPDPMIHKFYFDFGTKTLDKTYERYQNRADCVLEANGYLAGVNWITRKFEGHAHSEIDWRKRVHIPLEFLLKPEL
jgi:predicted alpha/beta superfamily hydrolase